MPKELDSGSLFKEYEIQCFVQVQSFHVHTTVPKKLLLLAVLIQKLFCKILLRFIINNNQ